MEEAGEGGGPGGALGERGEEERVAGEEERVAGKEGVGREAVEVGK